MLPSSPLPAELTSLVGQVVAGSYAIQSVRARAPRGAFFQARRLPEDTPVTLQVVPLAAGAGPLVAERLRATAHRSAALPHAAAPHAIGDPGSGPLFIATELLAGPTLEETLAAGPLTQRRALRILVQISEYLVAAHALGLLHLGTRPGSIFLPGGADDSEVRIADFGTGSIAQPADALELPCDPFYLSPEQASGKVGGPQADLYSLGALAYHLLSGAPPFTGDSLGELLIAHLTQDPPPLTGAPPVLAERVLRCLDKDPARRPGGEEMLQACQEALGLLASPGAGFSLSDVRFAMICARRFHELRGEGDATRYCDACDQEVVNLDPLGERERLSLFEQARRTGKKLCVAATVPPPTIPSCMLSLGVRRLEPTVLAGAPIRPDDRELKRLRLGLDGPGRGLRVWLRRLRFW